MAKWAMGIRNHTPVAVADATNFTDAGYEALQGGSTTQRIDVQEVQVGGLASSSAPAQMVVGRDSTVAATGISHASGYNAALDPATAALAAPQTALNTSTTKPQRSSTLQLLQLGFNAFGGLIRWVAAPGEELKMLGNAASFGELSVSHGAAGTPGLCSVHMVYETF
jgi:hypothetical protein